MAWNSAAIDEAYTAFQRDYCATFHAAVDPVSGRLRCLDLLWDHDAARAFVDRWRDLLRHLCGCVPAPASALALGEQAYRKIEWTRRLHQAEKAAAET